MINAKYLKSAVWPEDYPDSDRPELAMVGRSNAGKSSLLNAMVGPVKIAKISATPGKTRLINFFDIGDYYRVVDLPGYGWAARNETERTMWNDMITKYFESRENLLGIILVCDVRREWTEDEDMILDLAKKRDTRMRCVLSKIDKLSRAELQKQKALWLKTSGQPEEFFRFVSVLNKIGVKEFEDYVFKSWVKES